MKLPNNNFHRILNDIYTISQELAYPPMFLDESNTYSL